VGAVTTGNVSVPGVGINECYADVVELPVSGNGKPIAGTPQSVGVCTSAAMSVLGVKINLS